MSQFFSNLARISPIFFAPNEADSAMNAPDSYPAVQGAILQDVMLVDRITRTQRGPYRAVSLPGHLVHVVVSGQVEQRTGGVTERYGAGDSTWYYQNEPLRGRILDVPWTFYSVNFHAPTLPPPPFGGHVKRVGPETIARMEALLKTWRDRAAPAVLRHLRLHAQLLELLTDLVPKETQAHRIDAGTQLWWRIETMLRADLSRPIDLAYLRKLTHRSQRSIFQACHLATGLPPMRRVRQLRLSYARGLVQLSDLSFSEIAYRVGYRRVQELSRDYRKHFGITPTQDRRAGPSYRRIERPRNME